MALTFLKEKLAGGPCPGTTIDDAVEAGGLRAASVEKAEAELQRGLSFGTNRKRGSRSMARMSGSGSQLGARSDPS
jgi:hypothetical protein